MQVKYICTRLTYNPRSPGKDSMRWQQNLEMGSEGRLGYNILGPKPVTLQAAGMGDYNEEAGGICDDLRGGARRCKATEAAGHCT